MTTRHTPERYHLAPEPGHAWPAAARLRVLLGILLILVGSVWLGLNLTGHTIDVPLPIRWLEGIGMILEYFNGPRS